VCGAAERVELFGEGTTFRVTVALTFKAGFEGAKGVYLEVEDYGGLRAIWQQVGTWTVGFP
jgi:hypothetical protein